MPPKKSAIFVLSFLLITSSAWSSPWAEGKTYGEKTGGKALFGVKNALLGWTAIFTEPVKYQYYLEKKKSWEGLCYGISKAVLYTANGAVHFVTFPFPVDFPNLGEGILHTSIKDQAAREQVNKEPAKTEADIEAANPEVNADATAETSVPA